MQGQALCYVQMEVCLLLGCASIQKYVQTTSLLPPEREESFFLREAAARHWIFYYVRTDVPGGKWPSSWTADFQWRGG